MAQVNFYLKNPNEKEDTLIYLFFSYNGQRFKYSVSEKILPKFWNTQEQRVKKSFSGSLEINNHLDRIEGEIKKIYRNGIISGKAINNQFLKEELECKLFPSSKSKNDFFDLFTEFIEVQQATKTNKTIQKYKTLFNHLKEFQTRKKYVLTFDRIDMKFYEKYVTYYINDLKLLNNSVAKYIKTLKTFLNWATERGYNTNNTFAKFKAKERDADIIYLTEQELFLIYNYDLSNKPALEKVRDTFCFCCFTGLRYSDLIRLKKKNIKGEEIHLVSEKTTDNLIIPLNKFSNAILSKYNHSLPYISNQKTNEHLKELGKLCGITEPVTLTQFRGVEEIQVTKPKCEFIGTHTARRTFVTLSLEKGMRAETVMNITGHKEYNTFKKYIKITSKVKLVEMKKVWDNDDPKLTMVKRLNNKA